jgi:hypothetical protein
MIQQNFHSLIVKRLGLDNELEKNINFMEGIKQSKFSKESTITNTIWQSYHSC